MTNPETRHISFILFFMAVGFLATEHAYAACNQPPIPTAGQTVTWTKAKSPFQICTDLTIPKGGKVIVEPGVRVDFQAHTLTVSGMPIILFLPLYILFFGLGPASKIALGATISFFPVVLNTIAGFGNVDRIFTLSARSMGASDFQLFRWVLLPAAFPVILTGLRIGFTVALLSILGSETIASLAGLGHRIVHLAEGMDTARMFAYIAFAVAIALFLNTVTSTLEARAKRR